MEQKTILYVGGFELPDKNAAAHRVLGIGKILRHLGYNVVFIGVNRNFTTNKDIQKTQNRVQGFTYWEVSYPHNVREWGHYLCSIRAIEAIYKIYSNSLCGIICYNYQSFALKRVIRFGKKNNLFIISDCTEWYSAKGKGCVFFFIKGFDTFYRMRILNKKVDGVIAISEFLDKYYSRYVKTIKLPPLVDLSEEKWFLKDNRAKEDFIVYAGNPGKKENIKNLVSFFSSYKGSTSIIFIGISKHEYLLQHPEDKDILQQSNCKVTFLGRLAHQETLEYIKRAKFACFLRDSNRVNEAGFPTKFVESISCNTPVITTNTSDLKHYISNKENGYFVDMISLEENLFKILERKDSIKVNRTCFCYRNYIDEVRKFIERLQ